jgi:hypothetical protein
MVSFGKKSLHLLLRFGPFLFVPAFLFLAYNYISSKSPLYKVSASISVDGAPQQSTIEDLKSKDLLAKVAEKLPLQASYYFASQPKKEIYPDSSPVKVVIKKLNDNPAPVWITLHANDNRQFELTRGDTSAFHKFNQPINESYGTFSVMRNDKADSAEKPVNVKMVGQAEAMNTLYNDLHVGAGHKENVIQLSLVAGNAKRGADLLNALLNIYGSTIDKGKAHLPATKTITTVQYDTIKNNGKNLTALKNKAAVLTRQIASLKGKEENPDETVQVKKSNVDPGQAKIYKAVDAYIKKPIDQFVQVPYVDEIENPDLNDQVNEFNETELTRRRLTRSSQIDSVNRKLMTLRSNIVEQVRAYLRNGHSESNRQLSKGYYENQIAAKQSRLDEINKEIKTGMPSITIQRSNKVKTVSINQASSKMVVLDKPEDNIEYMPVRSVLIYGLALLAGLLFPVAGWIIRVVHRGSSSRQPSGGEKLSDQISDLFRVKQID